MDSESLQGAVGIERACLQSRVQCPTCGDEHPHRLERKGFLEQKVFPLFGFYPWLCGSCRTSFLMRKRYRRKVRSQENAAG